MAGVETSSREQTSIGSKDLDCSTSYSGDGWNAIDFRRAGGVIDPKKYTVRCLLRRKRFIIRLGTSPRFAPVGDRCNDDGSDGFVGIDCLSGMDFDRHATASYKTL